MNVNCRYYIVQLLVVVSVGSIQAGEEETKRHSGQSSPTIDFRAQLAEDTKELSGKREHLDSETQRFYKKLARIGKGRKQLREKEHRSKKITTRIDALMEHLFDALKDDKAARRNVRKILERSRKELNQESPIIQILKAMHTGNTLEATRLAKTAFGGSYSWGEDFSFDGFKAGFYIDSSDEIEQVFYRNIVLNIIQQPVSAFLDEPMPDNLDRRVYESKMSPELTAEQEQEQEQELEEQDVKRHSDKSSPSRRVRARVAEHEFKAAQLAEDTKELLGKSEHLRDSVDDLELKAAQLAEDTKKLSEKKIEMDKEQLLLEEKMALIEKKRQDFQDFIEKTKRPKKITTRIDALMGHLFDALEYDKAARRNVRKVLERSRKELDQESPIILILKAMHTGNILKATRLAKTAFGGSYSWGQDFGIDDFKTGSYIDSSDEIEEVFYRNIVLNIIQQPVSAFLGAPMPDDLDRRVYESKMSPELTDEQEQELEEQDAKTAAYLDFGSKFTGF